MNIFNIFKNRADKKTFKATLAYLNRPGRRRYEELSYDLENESFNSNMSREEMLEWVKKSRELLCLSGMVGGWTPKELKNGKLVPIDCLKYMMTKPYTMDDYEKK